MATFACFVCDEEVAQAVTWDMVACGEKGCAARICIVCLAATNPERTLRCRCGRESYGYKRAQLHLARRREEISVDVERAIMSHFDGLRKIPAEALHTLKPFEVLRTIWGLADYLHVLAYKKANNEPPDAIISFIPSEPVRNMATCILLMNILDNESLTRRYLETFWNSFPKDRYQQLGYLDACFYVGYSNGSGIGHLD